jgi:hypothetical protein
MANSISPFKRINPEAKLAAIFGVVDYAEPFKLPDDPTPEQFAKAEPIMLQQIIEENFDTAAFEARQNGQYQGNIIDPLDMNRVRRVAPGRYVGEFTDNNGSDRYRFELDDKGITFSPIRP